MRVTYTSKRAHRPGIFGANLAPSMTSTNWSPGAGAQLSNDAAGNLLVNYNGVVNPYAEKSITVVANSTYRFRCKSISDGSAKNPIILIGTGPTLNDLGEFDFRKTTPTDAAGDVDVHVRPPGTTVYITLLCITGSAGYAKFNSLYFELVTTVSHALISTMVDDVALGPGAYNANLSTLSVVALFNKAERSDNALRIANSGTSYGEAIRINRIPCVSGRDYLISCLWFPYSCLFGRVYVDANGSVSQKENHSDLDSSTPFFTPGSNLRWNFTNTDDGWIFTNATRVNNATTISLTSTTTNPKMTRSGLSFSGYENRYVARRVRRTSATFSTLCRCLYATAAHGTSASYIGDVVATLVQNEWTIIVFDMWQLSTGGEDWKNSTITAIEIETTNTNGATWDEDWIAVGNINPLEIKVTALSDNFLVKFYNSNESNAVSCYLLPHATQLDSDYTLEQPGVAQLARVRPKSIGTINTAESGKKWGVASRSEGGWRVTTDKFAEAARADWEEFLNSVDLGEEFTFDANGTTASPDNPVTVTLREGTGEVDRLRNVAEFHATFEVVEVLD